MSHSTVVVFFIVLVGINITHGQEEDGVVFCHNRTGICLSSLAFTPFPCCCPMEPDCPECPKINRKSKLNQTCCVDCHQDWINDECETLFSGSVSQYYTKESPCCPDMLQVAKPFDNSPCRCCQKCKPKARCRGKSFCITDDDPTYNPAKCLALHPEAKIVPRLCRGEGCSCCVVPK